MIGPWTRVEGRYAADVRLVDALRSEGHLTSQRANELLLERYEQYVCEVRRGQDTTPPPSAVPTLGEKPAR